MRGSPRWWLERLRAMSPGEIAHRAVHAARAPFEHARIALGVYAIPPPDLARSAFHTAHALRARVPSFGDDDLRAAERICDGERRVLGAGWIRPPEPPSRYEPLARASWPHVRADRVIRAAPPHFDARSTWELSRGHEWIDVARAFAATRRRAFRDWLVGDLAAWQRDNPLGAGINWVSPMEAAIRIHALAWVGTFLDADDTALASIARLIYTHAMFVWRNLSRFSSANNHLLVELTGILVAARSLGYVGFLEAATLSARAQLHSELARQTFPDGVNAEMALHYHLFVLEALLLVAWSDRAWSDPDPVLEGWVARMAGYARALQCADGTFLQQGDNDDGKVTTLFGSPAALVGACASVAPEAVRGPERSVAFRDSGQYMLRSARLHVALDAGPFGFGSLAAHAHCDALAICLAVDGHRLLVDRGTYRYNGDRAARDRFRMTAAHTTVQPDEREQGDATGPFLWGRKPRVTVEMALLDPAGDLVAASHDGFAPAAHRRILARCGDHLLVLDELVGVTSSAVARFHFAPEIAVQEHGAGSGYLYTCSAAGTTRARLQVRADGASEARIVDTPHSDEYGAIMTAPTLEIIVRAPGSRAVIGCLLSAGKARPTALESSTLHRLAAAACTDARSTQLVEQLVVASVGVDEPASP